jgi:polar amino acid transport system substrate-binding protein
MRHFKVKSFKRYAAFLLAAILMCSLLLTACGSQSAADSSTDEAEETHLVESLDDLHGARIGVQLGTTGDIYVTDEYESDGEGTVLERYNKGADAIMALKQSKIDAVIIDSQPAQAFVAKNEDLSILEEEFATEDYAICVSKDNPELTASINSALDTLKADGTVEQIISNFIGDDTKGTCPYESTVTEYPNGKLVVVTNASFEPYEYYSNGTMTGIDIQLMQAIADQLGMELEMQDTEFDSIINSVISGKADAGIAGMTVTAERLQNIDFTDSYTTSKQVVVVRNGKTATSMGLAESFYQCFIYEARWQYLTNGLKATAIVTICSAVLGMLLGWVLAIIRVSHDKNGTLPVLNFIAKIYLTVIRGTPTMIQLLITCYVIFASVNINRLLVAIIAFSANSAAYVAEIVRSGMMSIDNGQFEAGRSLGLTFPQTMVGIVVPQAFKNVLPALANEVIVLLKETSIMGYVGLQDLTRGGDIIRNITYSAMLPLLAVAAIYLVIVMIMTSFVSKLERSLKKNER